ncbi:MAG: ribonuclease HII [Armatimonadota bacterium]
MLERFPGCAGVDEAGRGPLAGPVVAAAVIIPANVEIKGLNDSKKLTREQRERLEIEILDKAIYSISFVDNREIDELNILWASMAAMSRAIKSLSQTPTKIYIDGNRLPRDIEGEAVVKGDGKIAEIAAASILAKVARDRYMATLMHAQYPNYGFDRHFGYPTPEHFEALSQHGPCEIHRFSYAPIQALSQASLF